MGKQEQKETKPGEIEQSTDSVSLDQVDLGEDGIAVTEVGRTHSGELSASRKGSAAPRMDTVEISQEGRAASTQNQAVEDTDQYEAEDLSEYTDSELKQMYYRGDITLQEYEDETGESLE